MAVARQKDDGEIQELPRHSLVLPNVLFMSEEQRRIVLRIWNRCSKSLKRLKCDYLTLFCHRYDETKEEVVRAMDDLIHQGKSYTGGPAWPGDKIQAAVDLAKTTTRIHRRATATTWLTPAVANEIVPICIKAGGKHQTGSLLGF